jgi:transposase
VVEQLNLAGMLRNRRLARSLLDAGLAELRRQLAYKTAWYGSRLVVADRFHPSSKTCSACGWVKAKLSLVSRVTGSLHVPGSEPPGQETKSRPRTSTNQRFGTLAERTFKWESCGLQVDRDLNAARNLAKLAQHVAQSGWETQNARGADIRPGLAGRTALKREAGAEFLG